ncbi:hypothetical protein [Roseiconus lacunae]|uniref:Transcriptional regulator n=1 Tax=Roseiconus lacunae TaxID=2605694 RepID=A0ABT7PMR9_9BACT|nr:hypothetical protein [Roseiconus lacunae]MDM4017770.1 hypothetical protein [Roseiconus lacunae]
MTESPRDEDEPMPLAALARLLPGKPAYTTVRRWASDGRTSQSGKLVRLETVRLTNGLGSSIAKYKAFLAALQE